MPSASDFKKAFNLNKGAEMSAAHDKNKSPTTVANITNSRIGHTAKRPNELYEFPSTIDVEIQDKTTTSRRLEAAVRHFLGGEGEDRIVYSAYGSPYACTIMKIKIDSFDPDESHASITFLGKAARRRDIPTLGKQKEEERKKQLTAAKKRKRTVPMKDIEISKEDEHQWLLPQMRIIQSRFGSSKCTLCGETIDQGTKIAKDSKSTQRGGWMHASCAVEQAKINKKNKQNKQSKTGRTPKKTTPAVAQVVTAKKKRRPS